MATIDIDEGFCTQFTRHEWMLFLNICSKMDANKEAFISMKELEQSTQWHYQKVLVNASRLVQMGLIENTPTDDSSGDTKVLYRVLASNVRYSIGKVPSKGFSPRIPQNPPRKQKQESKPISAVAEVQKRKRTPVLISQKAERVNF